MNRIVSLASNVLRSNITTPPHPYKLTYAITYRCNSRCTICSIWKRKIFNELSLSELHTFFTRNPYFNWIDVTGGEVFLKPDFLKIIQTIITSQKNLYLLHIPTNGILSNKIFNDVTSILNMHPNRFIITCSIDGPPALHDKLRGIKNNWEQTVQTYNRLKTIQNSHFQCYVGMTLSGYNFRHIENTYTALSKKIPGFSRNDLHFNIAHHSYHYYGNTEASLGDMKNIIKKLKEFTRQTQSRIDGVALLDAIFQRYIEKYLTTHKTPIPCKALSSSIFLNPEGILYPCSMWNLPLGNVRKFHYDLKKLWKSSVASKTRNTIKALRCPNCWTPCEAYQSILSNLKTVFLPM